MRLFNSPTGYGAVAQVLHWVTVVLVILAWTLGIFGDLLPRGEPRHAGLFIHIAAGTSVIVLVIARLTWRLVDLRPLSEATKFSTLLGRWGDALAGIAHYALYALLVVVPVAGLVLQFARGEALPLFGLVTIPSPWLKDATFAHSVKEVHEILAHALVILAALHASAALVHHWVFRDRTLIRMLPHTEE